MDDLEVAVLYYFHCTMCACLVSQNALNIIPLGLGLTDLKKIDHSGFSVTTLRDKKVFR